MVIKVATNDMDDVQGPDEEGAGLCRSLRTHSQLSHLLRKKNLESHLLKIKNLENPDEKKPSVLASPAMQHTTMRKSNSLRISGLIPGRVPPLVWCHVGALLRRSTIIGILSNGEFFRIFVTSFVHLSWV